MALAYDMNGRNIKITLRMDGDLTTGDGKDTFQVPWDFYVEGVHANLQGVGIANDTESYTDIMLSVSGGGWADMWAADTVRIIGTTTDAQGQAYVERGSFNTTGKALISDGDSIRLDLDAVPATTTSTDVEVTIYGVGA